MNTLNAESRLTAPMADDEVETLFQAVLGRPTGNAAYRRQKAASGISMVDYVRALVQSLELEEKLHRKALRRREDAGQFPAVPATFRAPETLQTAPTPVRRILVMGSCLASAWMNALSSFAPQCQADLFLLNVPLPAEPPRPIADYQFILIQPPLRSAIPDNAFARLAQSDLEGHQRLFDHACNVMRQILVTALKWNRQYGITTFVTGLLVPQQNSVGRLMGRYDLRNPAYFVEKLNEMIAAFLADYAEAYYLDINEIASSIGKRYVQEDAFHSFNHNAFITDFDFESDHGRLEPQAPATVTYANQVDLMFQSVWHELMAMYRSVRQADSVKLVAIDLDDTLWRGTAVEEELNSLPSQEGWPIGFQETLLFLKRRGILLAIISRNDEDKVKLVWDAVLGTKGLRPEDFAVRKINWRPKSQNMAEILDAVGLQPHNVVFIDDNPVQRAEMQGVFPDMRMLGGLAYLWRHILLWAPETQTPVITDESAARTLMVQAQVDREDTRKTLSRDDFLASLEARMTMSSIDDVRHASFPRAFELINKTNQFNTTGQRWTQQACVVAFADGVRFHAFEFSDRFTDYGLVGVLIADRGAIRQFVMSCRILGMDAELAAIASVVRATRRQGAGVITAAVTPTDRNLPCRDVYARSGFTAADEGWMLPASAEPVMPAHVALSDEPD